MHILHIRVKVKSERIDEFIAATVENAQSSLREPGCAVRAAAESGALHARRYESYRRLRRLREELVAARGRGP